MSTPSDTARAALDAVYEELAFLEAENRTLRLQRECIQDEIERYRKVFRTLAQQHEEALTIRKVSP
jgi:hypothetical protein